MSDRAWRKGEAKRTLVLFALPFLVLGAVPLSDFYKQQVKQRRTQALVDYARTPTERQSEILWLIDNGADAHAKMPSGESVAGYMARLGHLDIVHRLQQSGAPPDAAAKRLSLGTALLEATRKGNTEWMQSELDQGADVNFPDRNGDTPLSTAITKSGVPQAALLLRNGADVRAISDGNSILAQEIGGRGRPEMLRLLLRAGAPTNPRLNLFLTVLSSRPREAEKYLRAGVPADSISSITWAKPLMWAAMRSDPTMVRLLLRYGANPSKTDRFGYTPLDYAQDARLNRTVWVGPLDKARQQETIAILKRAKRS